MLHETCDVLMTAVAVSRTEDKHYHSRTGSEIFGTRVLIFLRYLWLRFRFISIFTILM
jgi:hypothetical protein